MRMIGDGDETATPNQCRCAADDDNIGARNEFRVFAESSGRIWGLKAQESCAFPSDFGFRCGLRFGIRDG